MQLIYSSLLELNMKKITSISLVIISILSISFAQYSGNNVHNQTIYSYCGTEPYAIAKYIDTSITQAKKAVEQAEKELEEAKSTNNPSEIHRTQVELDLARLYLGHVSSRADF